MVKKKAEPIPEAVPFPAPYVEYIDLSYLAGKPTCINLRVANIDLGKANKLVEDIRKLVEYPDEYKVERKMGDYYVTTGISGGTGYTAFTSNPA